MAVLRHAEALGFCVHSLVADRRGGGVSETPHCGDGSGETAFCADERPTDH
jgi:hypothetical protein